MKPSRLWIGRLESVTMRKGSEYAVVSTMQSVFISEYVSSMSISVETEICLLQCFLLLQSCNFFLNILHFSQQKYWIKWSKNWLAYKVKVYVFISIKSFSNNCVSSQPISILEVRTVHIAVQFLWTPTWYSVLNVNALKSGHSWQCYTYIITLIHQLVNASGLKTNTLTGCINLSKKNPHI